MEAGKLLRGLQLRSDLVATGAPKTSKSDQDAGPAGSLDNLPPEIKRMLIRQALTMGELPWKRVDKAFKGLSDEEFESSCLSWGDAYNVLTHRYLDADEEDLKEIACRVLDMTETRNYTVVLQSKTFSVQTILEIAAYYSLTLPPFNLGVYQAKSTLRLSFVYIPDQGERLAYNNNMGPWSRGLLLEDLKAFVFAVCNGALEKLVQLTFESATSKTGVTTFFSSVSNSALPELEFLSIENNRLGDDGMRVISTALKEGALKNLKHLAIAENQIDDVGMASFSEAISGGAARSLGWLSITGNRIGGTAFFSALSKLSAEQTRLSAPPDTAIAPAHTQLHTLDLVCNQIGDDCIVELSTILRQALLPKLRRLLLGCNRIGDKGVIELVSALSIELKPDSEIEVLENLGLDGNPIGERGMKELLLGLFPQASQHQNAERVSTMRKRLSYDIEQGVTRVDIWCSNNTFHSLIHENFKWLYPERTTQVDDMLLDAIQLHAIVVSRDPDNLSKAALAVDPNYGSNTAEANLVDEAYKLLRMCAYYKLMMTHFAYATDTEITLPSPNDWPGRRDFKAVCFALCSGALRDLTDLDGSSRHLNDEATVTLSSTIATGALTELVDLRLNYNDIGDNGMIAFADAIKPCEETPGVAQGKLTKLNSLDFGGNRIGDKGMEAFSSALHSGALASLRYLCLSSNQAGEEGMKAFSRALSNGNLKSLTNLWLDGNQIGDKGIEALSRALPGGALASLENLYIGSNNIGGEGMGAFADAIKPTSESPDGALASLQNLVLNNNKINDDGMIKFSDALSGGALQKLERLNLDYNSISDAGVLKFIDVLSSGRPEHLSHLRLQGNPASKKTIDRIHDVEFAGNFQLFYGIGNEWEQ